MNIFRRAWFSSASVLAVASLGALFMGCAGTDGTGEGETEPVANDEAAAVATRPNFLIFLTDDQRADLVTPKIMPNTRSRIFDQGVQFRRAYAPSPLCEPSRASIMTGLYPHRSGINDNTDRLTKPTVHEALHDANYFTGNIGKYMNTEGLRPRPEYDFWVSIKGSGPALNPMVNVNGKTAVVKGYDTYIMRDQALEFLDAAKSSGKPFDLTVAFHSPHVPSLPAPGDEKLFGEIANPTERRMAQTLWSTDQAINSVLDRLHNLKLDKNTVVIFMSDHGWMLGEHGVGGKRHPYEESIRIPFAVYYPPLTSGKPHTDDSHLVANLDVAGTLYDLAGVAPPTSIDGLSLRKALTGGPWRDYLLIEGNWNASFATKFPRFRGIHGLDDVYWRWQDGKEVYFDLTTDPGEDHNLIGNPAANTKVKKYRSLLSTFPPAP